MKRLRHPIRAIREPFGTAGLIVACVALVAALGGTALAAAKLNGTQKKEVEKIAKKFAGKPGAAGAGGAAGPTGPAGAAGAQGKEGSPGKQGIQGKEGTQGKEGSPWTAGGTLPEGETLKGEWNADSTTVSPFTVLHAAVSYALPLSAAPHAVYVGEASDGTGTGEIESGSTKVKHITTSTGTFTKNSEISGAGIPPGSTITAFGFEEFTISNEATETKTGVQLTAGLPAGCTGNAQNPAAEEGYLCVFTTELENAFSTGFLTVQPKVGFTIGGVSTSPPGESAEFHGTWAVTAE